MPQFLIFFSFPFFFRKVSPDKERVWLGAVLKLCICLYIYLEVVYYYVGTLYSELYTYLYNAFCER